MNKTKTDDELELSKEVIKKDKINKDEIEQVSEKVEVKKVFKNEGIKDPVAGSSKDEPSSSKMLNDDKLKDLGTLANESDRIMAQVGKLDMIAASTKAELIIQENKEKLLSNIKASEEALISPNNWKSIASISTYEQYKIVKNIPKLVKLRVTKLSSHNTSLLTFDAQGWNQVEFIDVSMKMFGGNAMLVDYVIDSSDTYEKLSYNDETIPETTLNLVNFIASPLNANLAEDHTNKTKVLSGLLELVLKVRKAGDVFIQGGDIFTLGTLGVSDQPVDMLRGSKIPRGMEPSIFIGVTGHELQWFKNQVVSMFDNEDFVYGETSDVVFRANGAFKAFSYYGVTTDSLFSTLHHIAMKKFDDYRIKSYSFPALFQIFAPLGGSIQMQQDIQIEFWDVQGISKEMLDQYRFVFLLSSSFRSYVYSRMVTMNRDMGMITVVPNFELTDSFSPTPVNIQNNAILQTQIVADVRRYDLTHFYEALNMELFHAFISPANMRSSFFRSYQSAALALFSIGLDALYFPNMFWSNVGLSSKALYDAFRFLDRKSYDVLMANGYSKDVRDVRDLDKITMLRGIVPYLFLKQQSGLIGRYMRAIAPAGGLKRVVTADSDISPSMNRDAEFYVPWLFRERPSFGSIGVTPLCDKIEALALVVCDFIDVYRKNFNIANAEAGAVKTLFNNMAGERNKIASSVMHFEVNIVMRHMMNMPWIPYFTYKGQPKFNDAPLLGLRQFDHPDKLCLPCVDTAVNYPHGIGLWTLLNIHGDQLMTDGTIKKGEGGGAPILFPDPVRLYSDFDRDVKHCIPIGEAFGFMSYILNANEANDNPFQFLFNILGTNLKAGTVSQILKWLLPNGLEPIVTYLDGTKLTVKHPDQRLRNPAVTKIDGDGHAIPSLPGDHDVFFRPLDLLDRYEIFKFYVALSMIGNHLSPLHKISMGLTFAHEFFENMSPQNRHSDDVIDVDFDDNLFGILIVHERSVISLNYGGNTFTSINDIGFPLSLRIVIEIPSIVTQDQWTFMRSCVSEMKWQLYFPNQLFIAKIVNVSYAMMKMRPPKEDDMWDLVTKRKYGELIEVVFYDTTSDYTNTRMEVVPNAFRQYVCALQSVQRNIVLKNMYSLTQPPGYVPPEKKHWEIGMKIPSAIPMDINGVPKYLASHINFNNFVRVYTNEVSLNKYPEIKYVPPLIQTLSDD